MFTPSKCIAPSATTLLAAILSTAVAQPVSAQVSTVLDPVGDVLFSFNPPFQDFVFGQMTKTASGDFELLMELAAPVPVAPPLLPQGNSEQWWFWIFELDPATWPQGYPWQGQGSQATRPPEFMVYVSWDGTEFAGNAIDRRPLLTGGEAIVAPVTFGINGTIVEAVLPSELIGAVPASFRWGAFTSNWSGPVGSGGFNFADYQETVAVFNPPQPAAPGCYPDCNADSSRTVADFECFQTKFVLGDPYADCNGDGQRTVADFGCFQTKFVVGCP